GILYLAIGLFRLGEIMSFISHSAVKGFTSAAALIIIATQLPHFLGVTVSRHEYIFPMLIELAGQIPLVHIPTLAIGIVSLAILYGIKRFWPKFPSALVALVIATGLVALFQLHLTGVAIIGQIPSGLPCPHLPPFDFETMSSLMGPAVVIGLVSFAETYSVGKAISSETRQMVNVNQELVGQGLANFIGSFFQSYPVNGSFSRTAINYTAGAKTGMSSVISSMSVVLALLFLTPLFTYIPQASLAALVISAVLILFNPKKVFALWKMNRHDGIVGVSVFTLALLTKPDYALLIGVIISLIFFLWQTMHPRIVRVTKDPELNMFVNADLHNKPSCPQILQLRSDNVICFANAEYTLEHLLERVEEQTTPVKFLLLDLEAMGFIDITGIDELRVLHDKLITRGIELALMGVRLPVRKVFDSTGFTKEINPEHLIENRRDAISRLFRHIDHEYCKSACPYQLYIECSGVK
ncbi:MAG: SulP family inorganic anion transporter, partial [Desulfobulbaceae bacterium]|nr:SulP family inorganic anion transporter [Desulfobulbaceae bacterium]